MKSLIAATLLVLGFSFTAHAEENLMPTFPVDTQEATMTSATDATDMDMDMDMDMDIQGHHTGKYNYCCVQSHGGGYCKLDYSDNYGAPCKCSLGNNVTNGHVCN